VPANRVLVVEDDPVLRAIAIALDPATPAERVAACAEFFADAELDFAGWCERVRARVGALFPSTVRLVDSPGALRAALPGSPALVVDALRVGADELAAGDALRVVQKYRSRPDNIDAAACAARGIKLLTVRRRADMVCAEIAITLMLTLAKKLHRFAGRISVEAMAELGYPYKPFDRRHVPNANWPRISGLRSLNEATLGLTGLGEVGRETAIRAGAFGMRILYHQHDRLTEAEERALNAAYVPLAQLLAESDWVVAQLPRTPATVGCIGRAELAQMQPGAFLVDISDAEIVDRAALIDALASGRLGGYALAPLNAAPRRGDDELLAFDNVVLAPPIAARLRLNALDDLAGMMERLAKELAS
jgi:phosphoglycerate dehydrogenase-like enzyme